MKSERWQRIEQLYRAALEPDPAERAAFLATACAEDAMLHRETLLGSQNETNDLMEVPASQVAAKALAADCPRWLGTPGSTRCEPIRHSRRPYAMPKRANVRHEPPSSKLMAIGCVA